MSALGVWQADLVRRMKFAAVSKDDRGSVAIMFALTIFVVFTLVGGAVDLGRAMVARERLQSAVDSSVLAAARVWQLENDLTLAEEKALAHFDTNKPQEVSRVVSFTPDMQAATFTMVGETTVPTPFLSLVRQSITVSTRGQALIAGGGNAGTNLEVSLMLDVTGSMAGTQDHGSQGRGQGPDRHRRVGRPDRVHLARGAGAVLGRGQRRQRARSAGRLQSVVQPVVQAAQRRQQHALSDEHVLPC